MNLKVKYLGLELNNPIVVASSPFTSSLSRIQTMEENGAGAVVLKSIFEEQIAVEAGFLDSLNNYPEAADYLNHYVKDDYLAGHLNLIGEAKKKTNLPIIASINCISQDGWLEYAEAIEKAGADALELNIFILATSVDQSSAEMEKRYINTIGNITSRLKIPVSVKLSMRFTNILSICKQIYNRGGKGVVMFNSFFEPSIDIDTMQLVSSDALSSGNELRHSLRNVAVCSTQLPELDVSVSTGVHTGEDVIKAILVGAATTQICSTLYHNGDDVIGEMKKTIVKWMDQHGFQSIDDFRGLMRQKKDNNKEIYQRVQYMKFFPTKA